MARGANDGPGEALPKLSIGQRVLAALPNLQRDPVARSAGTRARAPRAGDGSASASASANGGGAVTPDAVLSPDTRTVGARSSGLGRVGGSRSAKSEQYANMSVAELRHAMKYLDDRERALPMLIGPLLVVLDLVLTVVALHDNPAVHAKGHADPTSIVVVGIGSAVVAGLVLVSALIRRRSFTIFALLFSGYGGGLVTLLPAWVLAGWLFIRFNRIQKALVAKQGGPAAARQAAAKDRSDRRSGGGRRRTTKEPPPPAGPSASKRYTPPKPTRSG